MQDEQGKPYWLVKNSWGGELIAWASKDVCLTLPVMADILDLASGSWCLNVPALDVMQLSLEGSLM